MPQSRLHIKIILLGLVVCLGLSLAIVHSVGAQKATPPKLVSGAASPEYPDAARDKMIVGDVVFRAKLTAEGSVESVDILQVPEKDLGFEDSVRETVASWKFTPATDGTNPIPYMYVGKVSFSLRPEDEEAIRGAIEEAVGEWNKGNAGKLASHFTKSEGRLLGAEELAKSSKKVEDWIKSRLADQYKDSEIKVNLDSIVFFPDSDLALITPFFTLSGAQGDGGEQVRGRLELILLKEKSDWNVLSGQVVSLVGREDFQVPKKISGAEPDYPSEARQKRVQGTVVLEGTVDSDGSVKDVEVLRSISALDKAAIEAVRKWKYEPARIGGSPSSMVTTMTVTFTIE